MAKKKNLNPLYVVIISILALLVLILVIVLITNGSNNKTGNVINSNSDNQDSNNPSSPQTAPPTKNCRDIQVPYTDNVCNDKNLIYSIPQQTFIVNTNKCNNQQYICKETFLTICTNKEYYCIDKTISCSLTLKNLDTDGSGIWGIDMNYIDKDTSNTIRTDNLSYFVYPQTDQQFTSSIEIISDSVNGDANKNITCSYQVVNIPTKQVCQYVTKYRTEQQCD